MVDQAVALGILPDSYISRRHGTLEAVILHNNRHGMGGGYGAKQGRGQCDGTQTGMGACIYFHGYCGVLWLYCFLFHLLFGYLIGSMVFPSIKASP
jgi:hypothetical protein